MRHSHVKAKSIANLDIAHNISGLTHRQQFTRRIERMSRALRLPPNRYHYPSHLRVYIRCNQ